MTGWPHDESFEFQAPLATGRTARHTVYVKGDGPPILMIQEMPGIGPETLALIDRLAAEGFRIYLPHLFGRFGTLTMRRNLVRLFCVRREIDIFARGRQSPVVNWLRALCREIRHRDGAPGVGVLGMCLTGQFALTMMADDAVLAGVASQPSLPGFGAFKPLPASDTDIAAAREGMQAKGPALMMRYEGDTICRPGTFDAWAEAFDPLVEVIRFPGKAHALLTGHFHEPAYVKMRDYFRQRMPSE